MSDEPGFPHAHFANELAFASSTVLVEGEMGELLLRRLCRSVGGFNSKNCSRLGVEWLLDAALSGLTRYLFEPRSTRSGVRFLAWWLFMPPRDFALRAVLHGVTRQQVEKRLRRIAPALAVRVKHVPKDGAVWFDPVCFTSLCTVGYGEPSSVASMQSSEPVVVRNLSEVFATQARQKLQPVFPHLPEPGGLGAEAVQRVWAARARAARAGPVKQNEPAELARSRRKAL